MADANWLTTAALGEPLMMRVEPSEVVPLLHAQGWTAHSAIDVHEVCTRYLPASGWRPPPTGHFVSLCRCTPTP
jgi:hypothetical protein